MEKPPAEMEKMNNWTRLLSFFSTVKIFLLARFDAFKTVVFDRYLDFLQLLVRGTKIELPEDIRDQVRKFQAEELSVSFHGYGFRDDEYPVWRSLLEEFCLPVVLPDHFLKPDADAYHFFYVGDQFIRKRSSTGVLVTLLDRPPTALPEPITHFLTKIHSMAARAAQRDFNILPCILEQLLYWRLRPAKAPNGVVFNVGSLNFDLFANQEQVAQAQATFLSRPYDFFGLLDSQGRLDSQAPFSFAFHKYLDYLFHRAPLSRWLLGYASSVAFLHQELAGRPLGAANDYFKCDVYADFMGYESRVAAAGGSAALVRTWLDALVLSPLTIEFPEYGQTVIIIHKPDLRALRYYWEYFIWPHLVGLPGDQRGWDPWFWQSRTWLDEFGVAGTLFKSSVTTCNPLLWDAALNFLVAQLYTYGRFMELSMNTWADYELVSAQEGGYFARELPFLASVMLLLLAQNPTAYAPPFDYEEFFKLRNSPGQ